MKKKRFELGNVRKALIYSIIFYNEIVIVITVTIIVALVPFFNLFFTIYSCVIFSMT